MSYEIKEGDRVKLKNPDGWLQPFRRYGEEGRSATVERIYTPFGATEAYFKIRFDMKRRSKHDSGVLTLRENDLILQVKP